LTDKLSDKNKKDWENFINSSERINDKDEQSKKNDFYSIKKSIDLHGYTLDEANNKIFEFINDCYLNGVKNINIITGKGLRSKNIDNPYKSKSLGILKYSVPDFIIKNSQLMKKIIKIDFESVNSPLKGNFEIILKTKKIEIK
tara:strand:+ start:409 stop:837 length:429 start_codon:yes stop_codon:yes gene_type:complete